jgi:hypothetical protein
LGLLNGVAIGIWQLADGGRQCKNESIFAFYAFFRGDRTVRFVADSDGGFLRRRLVTTTCQDEAKGEDRSAAKMEANGEDACLVH